MTSAVKEFRVRQVGDSVTTTVFAQAFTIDDAGHLWLWVDTQPTGAFAAGQWVCIWDVAANTEPAGKAQPMKYAPEYKGEVAKDSGLAAEAAIDLATEAEK